MQFFPNPADCFAQLFLYSVHSFYQSYCFSHCLRQPDTSTSPVFDFRNTYTMIPASKYYSAEPIYSLSVYNPPDVCWDVLIGTMSRYFLCETHIFGLNGLVCDDHFTLPPNADISHVDFICITCHLDVFKDPEPYMVSRFFHFLLSNSHHPFKGFYRPSSLWRNPQAWQPVFPELLDLMVEYQMT
jgi:hypothetical protein